MSHDPARVSHALKVKVDFVKEIDTSVIKGQSALVTGGANGIGEAFAEYLAAAGAYVTIFDVQDEQGKATTQRLCDRGFKVQFVQGDVRSWDDQIKAFDAAIAFSPSHGLDIVLLVAGISGKNILQWLDNPTSPDGKLVRPDTKTIDINMTAVWHMTHLALHYFRQSIQQESRPTGSKQLVFVASLAAYMSNAYITDYAAAKWGVRGIWRTICDEQGLLGSTTAVKLRTNLIAPWFISTNMTKPVQETFQAVGVPFATVDDCADAMMRIVCDENVRSRAVAVAPDGKSFDLCDDTTGEPGREMLQKMSEGVFGQDPDALRNAFGLRQKSKTGP